MSVEKKFYAPVKRNGQWYFRISIQTRDKNGEWFRKMDKHGVNRIVRKMTWQLGGKTRAIAERARDKAESDYLAEDKIEERTLETFCDEIIGPEWAEAYQEDVKRVCNKISSVFGKETISQIKIADIEDFIDSLSCRGRRKNLYLTVFKKLFKRAYKAKSIPEEHLIKLGLIDRKSEKTTPPKALTTDEVKKLLSFCAAEDAPPWLYDAVLLGLATGLRRGTLVRLTWAHVDWDKKTFVIPADLMKMKNALTIPVGDILLRHLLEKFERNKKLKKPALHIIDIPIRGAKTSGMVWAKNRGCIVSKQFKKVAKKAKLSDKIKFHSLRKSFATNLMNQKVAIPIIAQLGGWKDPETIFRHYIDSSHEEPQRAAVNLLQLDGRKAENE